MVVEVLTSLQLARTSILPTQREGEEGDGGLVKHIVGAKPHSKLWDEYFFNPEVMK